jgi:hypothetical protein
MKRPLIAAAAALTFMGTATLAPDASAFCGFYVAPNDAPLYNDATMVALMREGTRMAINMSNNYKGPASDFAMVVPVPVVLQKENVKTLPHDIFKKLEALSAPRLVEYWEEDPCAPMYEYESAPGGAGGPMPPPTAAAADKADSYKVKIEAQFKVGEYDIVILSAEQSDGLERWLVDNKYNIPKGAAPLLAPYIKEQWKFFVAKIDVKKVQMDAQGVATLSPLRFSYESQDFRLPVRLGLLNAAGKQDLLIFVLSKDKRYEVANYPNAFIPTNIDVTDDTRNAFGPFYAQLFDGTLGKAGGRAVVTEYAWESSSCDPCPTPPLEPNDVATLGGDVLFNGQDVYSTVLTRLHTRYDASTLTEDLVFRAADPVVGGREHLTNGQDLEKGARKDEYNNFQARYAIRHPWTGPVTCSKPRRGVWGGPPAGVQGSTSPTPATNLAAAPRGSVLVAAHVKKGLDDPESYDRAAGEFSGKPAGSLGPRRACGCDVPGGRTTFGLALFGVVAIGAMLMIRRRPS